MNSADHSINKLSADLFRHESGKMIAVLARMFGTENLDLAEDVVQDTFIAAMNVWPLKGIPENPSGWLFSTAKNKAIDILRRNRFTSRFDFDDPDRKLLQSEYTLMATADKIMNGSINDDLLRMMYACCLSEISQENQIILILKTLCGFSTSEIAKAFLMTEANVTKKLYRTKEFFRENRIRPEFPPDDKILARTDAVMRAVYLIFNEGYNATHHEECIRKDLVDQSMYLCKLLSENEKTRSPEVYALMALMCFHTSRMNSRVSDRGDIILLAAQDRNRWNRKLIDEGNYYMNKAATGDRITAYHAQAAIAYEHCAAKTFDDTNWKNILSYYDVLAAIQPGSIVSLHRMAVMHKVYGAAHALNEIEHSPYKEEWEKNYIYYSLLGDIYAQIAPKEAEHNYRTAIELTRSDAEKRLLRKKISDL
jgi:RNA polymerase sigma factor (sigma-70 family)